MGKLKSVGFIVHEIAGAIISMMSTSMYGVWVFRTK